ncbi:MAG: B12-binding domain-containing radical SAM protein, partial [Treponema sp.]|nr:B12-binding domain-containing radical SAM protein [Treponema sp.]
MIPILLATINAKWIHPSLGLRLLKANLGEYEDQAELREFALRQPLAEKTGPLLAAAPRIVGLSVSIWNHKATVELLEALDTAWSAGISPRPCIILGGPEAAYLKTPSPLISHADWVVRGEGEGVFRELCGLLLPLNPSPGETTGSIRERIAALPSVKRIYGKFIEAHPVDIPAIASAYRLYTEEDLYRKLTYVESSRGCPWACAFCQSSLSQGVRVFPLERVLKELKELLDRGAGSFKFLDRSFNVDIPRAQRIMEVFLEHLERPRPDAIPGKPPLPPLWVH